MFSLATKTTNLIRGALKPMQNFAKMSSIPKFETLSVTVPREYVYHVELNRPDKHNALNYQMWCEIKNCFETLHSDEDCRVIVLSGSGKNFTSGLDLQSTMGVAQEVAAHEDIARKAKVFRKYIDLYQASMSSLELCQKPVILAAHGACVGAAVDMSVATDIRYCSKDAWFQIKEIDLGMAADVGTLQRLPKVIGSASLVRELCLTARKFTAAEALACGFVSQVFEDKESLLKSVLETADQIAKKSPVATQVTKICLNHARDHPVKDSLEYIALWNQMMLQSEDFANAVTGQLTKQANIVFSKL